MPRRPPPPHRALPATWTAIAAALACILHAAVAPRPARAQGLLDWTLRASPEPEALLAGGAATLWNPAGIAPEAGGRSEAWVTNLDAPDVTGVEGIAAAATRGIGAAGTVGAAYQHVGTGEIPRTEDSPVSEPGEISVDEDFFSLSVARGVGRAAVGAALRYRRSTHGEAVDDAISGELGAHVPLSLPLSPRVAAVLRGLGSDPGWLAGVAVELPAPVNNAPRLRVGYGAGGTFDEDGREHRFSAVASWRGILRAGFGLARGPDDEDWAPLWMLGADLGPYSLAILRESLANDFGAADSYRIAVELP